MKQTLKSYGTLALGIIIGLILLPCMIVARIAMSIWQVLYYSVIDSYKYIKDLIAYSKSKGNK